jgi:hypothetical protein
MLNDIVILSSLFQFFTPFVPCFKNDGKIIKSSSSQSGVKQK